MCDSTARSPSRMTGEDLSDYSELSAGLDPGVPDRLAVGRGNAMLVTGWCFHREQPVRSIQIVVGEAVHSPLARSMPRPDVLEAEGNGASTRSALHSGFWAIVPLESVTGERSVEIALDVTLAGGKCLRRALGSLTLEPDVRVAPWGHGLLPRPSDGRNPEVCICMTTFEPPRELFRVQIESIREQTLPSWTCVISDDGSDGESLRGIREILGNDSRFTLHVGDRRLGFYGNFERSLTLARPGAELIALADQDDRWYPQKLERLVGALGSRATLAYSDLAMVESTGRTLLPTLFAARPNQYHSLASQMITNTVPGAGLLFRRPLLKRALPFPPQIGHAYHDHWLGCVALAAGELAYVDEPLYDYVQHGGNVIAQHMAKHRPADYGDLGRPSLARLRKRGFRRSASRAMREWRRDYFEHVVWIELMAVVLRLRCDDTLTPAKRRDLARIERAEGSLAGLAWLAERWLRSRLRPSATMGRELLLLRGALWKRLQTGASGLASIL